MKRRSTEAEQRLRKERAALRKSSKEQAEELSDALALEPNSRSSGSQ